jgi:HlyD family secretion protein
MLLDHPGPRVTVVKYPIPSIAPLHNYKNSNMWSPREIAPATLGSHHRQEMLPTFSALRLPGLKLRALGKSDPEPRAGSDRTEKKSITHPIRDTSAADVAVDPALIRRRQRRLYVVGASIVIALCLLTGVAFSFWGRAERVVPRSRVLTAVVNRGVFVRNVAATGLIIAANSPTLYAAASGTVNFDVEVGERVSKGQLLGTVDSPGLVNERAREAAALDSLDGSLERQSIEGARAMLNIQESIDQAAVRLHSAQREYERLELARRQGVVAERDVAKAHDEVESAQLAFDHVMASRKLAEHANEFEIKSRKLERAREKLLVDNLSRRVENLTLRSPVDGIVGSRAVNQKTSVTENAALLTIVDLSALEVEFRVPESYAADLSPDMPAEISYGDHAYEGRVTTVSPEVDQSEVKGRVRFVGTWPAGLRNNQRVNVSINVSSRANVLKAERGAFVNAGGVGYVVAGDYATRRVIKVGAMSVREVEIVSGAAEGERLVISSLADFGNAPTVRLVD